MAEPKKIKSKGAPKMPQPAQPPLLEGVSTKKAKQPAGNQAAIFTGADEGKNGQVQIFGPNSEVVVGPTTIPRVILGERGKPTASGNQGGKPIQIFGPNSEVVVGPDTLPRVVLGPDGKIVRAPERNEFPDFTPVSPGNKNVATKEAARLSQQLGIPIRADRMLEAPWLGRIYNQQGDYTGQSNSMGWERNESRFWSEYQRQFPGDYKLLNADRTISVEFAKEMGWPTEGSNSVVGDNMEHHHVSNGTLVSLVPTKLHEKKSGKIHGKIGIETPKATPKAPVPFKAPPAKGGNASKGDSANSKKPVISAAPVDKVAPSASTEKPVETPKPVEIAKPPQLPERSLSSVSTNQARANESGKSAPPMNKVNFDASPGRRQVFERVGAPDMGPRNWGGPSSRGEAMGGAAQLLIEVEHMLQLQATVQDARRSGSLRTFRWWLQRGVIPPYRGITDRWFRDDDKTTDISEIIRSEGSNKLSGVEVGMLNDESQYAAFESWVKENIHTWDDLYLHFVYHLDSGVRLDLGSWKWTVKKWEWGDWWPATVSEENVEDKRISNFMDTVLSDLLGQKKTELENLSQQKEVFGRGSNARIVGKRHFRTDGFRDRSLYDPYTHIALMHYFQWQSPPLFYEVSHPSVPVGFTLVAGANLSTYLTIHDFRSHYGTVTNVNPTIGPPPIYDRDKPVMGWDSIMNLPVVLVKTDSLAAQ